MKMNSILLLLFSVSMAFGAAEVPKEKEKEITETGLGATEMSLEKKMKKAGLKTELEEVQSKIKNVKRIAECIDYLRIPDNITALQLKTTEYNKFFEAISMIYNNIYTKLGDLQSKAYELQTDIDVLLGKAKYVDVLGGLGGGLGQKKKVMYLNK